MKKQSATRKTRSGFSDMFKYIRYMIVKSLFFIPTRLLYTIIEIRFLKEKNLLKSSEKISDVYRYNEKKIRHDVWDKLIKYYS